MRHAARVWTLLFPPLPCSPIFRLRAVPHKDREHPAPRTLHPFPYFLPHPQALVFTFFALPYPFSSHTHPDPMGLSSSPLSLTSQPARASLCPWCLITYCSLPNPAFSGSHPHIHSYLTGLARCATRLARPQVQECNRACKEARKRALAT